MLSRFPDWPSRLENFLRAAQARRFRYGSFDCCLFTADAIAAMTGADLAAPYRGGYRSRKEAMERAAGIAGARSVKAIAEHAAGVHGLPEILPSQAQRGDLALIRRGRDYSVGIVALNGRELLIALKEGYGAVPLQRACRAWRV